MAERPELGEWSVLLGELGGRLTAALGGAAGREAQATALDAVKATSDHWATLADKEPQGFGRGQPRPQTVKPAWVEAEALPGLLRLAGDEAAGTKFHAKAMDALASFGDQRGGPKVDDRLVGLWKSHLETFRRCLSGEHGDLHLVQATVGFLRGRSVSWQWELLRAFAAVFHFFRAVEPVRDDEGRDALRQAADHLNAFPLGEILKAEGLARVLVIYKASSYCHRRWDLSGQLRERVAQLEPGGPRVCRFLREGGAELYVSVLLRFCLCHLPDGVEGPYRPCQELRCDPLSVRTELLPRLNRLLNPTWVLPATVAERGQLFADLGLGRLLGLLFRLRSEKIFREPFSCEVFRLRSFFHAARHSPFRRSCLPDLICFSPTP